MQKPTLDSVYEALKWYRIHPTKELEYGVKRHNDSMTDNESIFIKILGETNNVGSLQCELDAATIFPHAPQPLVDEIIFITHNVDGKRFLPATAWKYINGSALTPSQITGDQVEKITQDLFKIYAHPVDSLKFEVKPVNSEAVMSRISQVPRTIPTALYADVLKLAQWFNETIKSDLRITQNNQMLVHGDPHAGNVLITAKGAELIDYESMKHAPLEFDLACLHQNYSQIHGNSNAYQHFFTTF